MNLSTRGILAATALVVLMGANPAFANPPADPVAAPVKPAAHANQHRSYDKRFNACKMEARNAGVSAEAYQAFMKECMKTTR